MFVTLYGCARFFTEYFRTPDYEVTFAGITISAGQMLSLPMIVGGAFLLALAYRGVFTPKSTNTMSTNTATTSMGNPPPVKKKSAKKGK
jgi:phosphatidylglycerol:prolipoprotein diacylglycerol transferase